jgi:hypothetical protein
MPPQSVWAYRTVARATLVVGLAALFVHPGAGQQAKRVRLRGYVVQILSPTEFTLDDFRITDDRTYRVNVEDVVDLATDQVRIGADLEIEGRLDWPAGELHALTLKRQSPPEDHTPATTTISTAVPIEPGERFLWNWLRVKVQEPDFARRRSGGVTIRNDTHYEIIPNADIQTYIADLGASLVPPYQRDLSDDDPAKIQFRFYIVRRDQPGAVSLATGVVLVYTRTFEILKNEAQMASMLAHEIAHLTQKHLWRLDGTSPGPIRERFSRSFENQADRLGLEYATNAGYDPREAATTWKLMARKLGYSPLRSTHENFSVRRAFIMGLLEANYQDLDYRNLRTEESRYKQIADRVKKPF